jgi:hypothetical protein
MVLNTTIINADWFGAKVSSKTLLLVHGKNANLPPFIQQWHEKRTRWSEKAGIALVKSLRAVDEDAAAAALATGAPVNCIKFNGTYVNALSLAAIQYCSMSPADAGRDTLLSVMVLLLEWGADPFFKSWL